MSINHRFETILKSRNLNQKEFCRQSGYSEQVLSNFVTGKTKWPKLDFLIACLTVFPELNVKWLLLGSGPMWLSDSSAASASRESDAGKIGELQRRLDEREELFNRMTRILEQRVKLLEQEIARKDPDRARELGIGE